MKMIIPVLFSLVSCRPPIQHVVHLMMENRAFDTIFGFFDHNHEIDNLVGKEQFCNYVGNPQDKEKSGLKVCTGPYQVDHSDYEPNHMYHQTTMELFGSYFPSNETLDNPPQMVGFAHQAAVGNPAIKNNQSVLSQVMHSFHPKNIPVHAKLASEYAVFDRWFSSVPGPTQPNRAFSHAATSSGMFRNDPKMMVAGLTARVIQQDIADAGLSWKTYFQEIPSFIVMRPTRADMALHSRPYSQFLKDAQAGTLANYTYLEPFFGQAKKAQSNDGHAGGTFFHRAELLIKEVYETVRNSPLWNNTLLLITYDEHGGHFDHVPPPKAPNPDGKTGRNEMGYYGFDRLGVRVPAMLISPWIKKGSVIHEPKGPFPDSQFEHSSIPATLRSLFKLERPPLTKREEWAGRFDNDDYFLDKIRTDCPVIMPAVDMRGF